MCCVGKKSGMSVCESGINGNGDAKQREKEKEKVRAV